MVKEETKYREVLPRSWSNGVVHHFPDPHNLLLQLQNALVAEHRARKRYEKWISNPMVLIMGDEVFPADDSYALASLPGGQLQYGMAKAILDQDLLESAEKLSSIRRLMLSLVLDPYLTLNLSPEASPKQVYAAYRLSVLEREHFDSGQRRLLSTYNDGSVEHLFTMGQLELGEVIRMRLEIAHQILSQDIGSSPF